MHSRNNPTKRKIQLQQSRKTTTRHHCRRGTQTVSVIGFDIGGANTKASLIITQNKHVKSTLTASKYFPMWRHPEKLPIVLERLVKKTAKNERIDLVAVAMTAELADSFQTKREGVNKILNMIKQAFPQVDVLVVDVDGKLRKLAEAKSDPLKVAAANWAATGWLASQLKKNCVVIDVGSTTTSIIPVQNGQVCAKGETDLQKLILGELVYTGSLRTNVAATVQTVALKQGTARVSSEFFAQSADVHLLLRNISEAEYTVETADGKPKTRGASLARVARVVCADIETLTETDILKIAQHVYDAQISQIAKALIQVCNNLRVEAHDVSAVVTGLGRNFLAAKAATQAGFVNVEDFGVLLGGDVARVSTAFAVALMGASSLEGGIVGWTR